MTQRLALTMGDPAGVGPEIILKSLTAIEDRLRNRALSLILVGSRRCFEETASRVPGLQGFARYLDADALPGLSFVDVGGVPADAAIVTGEVSANAGHLAYLSVAKAVALATAGNVDGIVTAPLNKEAMNLAGHRYAGHTDLLANLTGSRDSVMMLAHGHLRVSHVSTHIALSAVPARVVPERIRRVVELTADALRRLGIAQPRIAVAALNPHAGEGGIFGEEDIEITGPTVSELRREGFLVDGPVPGDTVFVKLRARQYDAVVAMYHDQGHIPVKLLGFQVDEKTGAWTSLSGVNVTLGLPIVRTSVDHGTAFDIAGKGIASEVSFLEAIEFALKLCGGAS